MAIAVKFGGSIWDLDTFWKCNQSIHVETFNFGIKKDLVDI